MPMEHTQTEDGGLLIVQLTGEIDLEYCNAVRELLLDAVERYPGTVVDLSGVKMIDSSGVASLLEAFQTARKRGNGLMLAAVDDTVMRVLRLARLDTVFAIADDVEAAKRTLA